MQRTTLSRTLARFISGFRYENLPAQVAERGKTRILDALSACFAGQNLAWSKVAVALAGNSHGKATIVGCGARVAAEDAAMANSVLSHSVLMEDWATGGHPGVVVVPVALAVAEENHLSGTETVTAIVLGYDVLSRIALGMRGRMSNAFRTVPVFGPFGAVTSAGKLLKMTEDQMTSALSYAANSASGMTEHWCYGTMEGMFQAGITARNGILLARLAKCGANATETALDGQHGFYMAFGRTTGDANAVTADLGKRFLIMELFAKPYPACVNHQIPMELAMKLRAQPQFRASDIERIVDTISVEVKYGPGHDFGGPFTNQFQAQMSGQFCLAAALLGRPVQSPLLYMEHYADPEILALAQKTELVPQEGRERFKHSIEVFLKDGRRFAIEGDKLSQTTLTKEAMAEKFLTHASDYLCKAKADEVVDTVLNLDKLSDINKLTRLLRGPAPKPVRKSRPAKRTQSVSTISNGSPER